MIQYIAHPHLPGRLTRQSRSLLLERKLTRKMIKLLCPARHFLTTRPIYYFMDYKEQWDYSYSAVLTGIVNSLSCLKLRLLDASMSETFCERNAWVSRDDQSR